MASFVTVVIYRNPQSPVRALPCGAGLKINPLLVPTQPMKLWFGRIRFRFRAEAPEIVPEGPGYF